MDQIKQVEAELDKVAEGIPELVKVCDQYKVKPGWVLGGAIGAVVLIMLITQGYNMICAVLTCVYPMYQSIKTIENNSNEDTNMWLCFWTVFGIFQTVELFIGFILRWIPYYSIVRLLFFMYLMMPQTQGAKTLYLQVFKPVLMTYKDDIQQLIDNVSSKGGDVLAQGMDAAKEQMTAENILKAQQLAQKAQDEVMNKAQEQSEKKMD